MLPQNIEFTPEEERIIDEVDHELDKQFWRELGLPEPPPTEPTSADGAIMRSEETHTEGDER